MVRTGFDDLFDDLVILVCKILLPVSGWYRATSTPVHRPAWPNEGEINVLGANSHELSLFASAVIMYWHFLSDLLWTSPTTALKRLTSQRVL